jgi:mannose-6-phosphate isomerase-like protein (cupin superfamily)
MHVNRNNAIEKHNLPGLEHQTLAGKRDGLESFEIWRQTIDAGASTPVHRHACDEVIVILKGEGICRCGDTEHHFKEDETVVIPGNLVHQICNTGDTDLYIMATLAMAPVEVKTETGEAMNLPWDQAPA